MRRRQLSVAGTWSPIRCAAHEAGMRSTTDMLEAHQKRRGPAIVAPDSGGSQLHIELGLLAERPCPSHKSSD